jgi:hypothetical protein
MSALDRVNVLASVRHACGQPAWARSPSEAVGFHAASSTGARPMTQSGYSLNHSKRMYIRSRPDLTLAISQRPQHRQPRTSYLGVEQCRPTTNTRTEGILHYITLSITS